jgi:hypothetical protein
MDLWGNKKGMVTNFSIIAQWDPMSGNIPASDGKTQTRMFGKSIPEMGKSVCGELPAKADMCGWKNGAGSKPAK